jgi:hypothetical protein
MKLTQKEQILERLKQGKLNSYEATYDMRIKQAPTRIKELREAGYTIISVTQPNRSVDWVLEETRDRSTNQELAEWIKKRIQQSNKPEPVIEAVEPQMSLF